MGPGVVCLFVLFDFQTKRGSVSGQHAQPSQWRSLEKKLLVHENEMNQKKTKIIKGIRDRRRDSLTVMDLISFF